MATGRLGAAPVLKTRWTKEPTAGTTSLSGLDANSVSLVYSVGYEQVYRNGVLLSRGNDYTATDGTTITLTDATLTGDIIEVFANELIPLSDAIGKGQYNAKGALVSASAASTPATLAVGANGETLVADSSTTTGLRWQADWNTGKNKIINGDFGIWQRGTSFSALAQLGYYADRWRANWTAGGASNTFSRQTFTPGAAPVAGYEGAFFARAAATSGGASTQIGHAQAVEDVRTLAGQTVTLSYWAKADTNRTLTYYIEQNFGSGGSAAVSISGLSTQAITTSWTRYSVTFAFPSISGKTIGTSSYLDLIFYLAPGAATGSPALDIWGVQLEAGSVATPFTTATGTLAGELAACQRYYYRQSSNSSNAYAGFAFGTATATTTVDIPYKLAQTMRIAPTLTDFANLAVSADNATLIAVTNLAIVSTENSADSPIVRATVTGATQFRPYGLFANNNTNAYVGFSAEL